MMRRPPYLAILALLLACVSGTGEGQVLPFKMYSATDGLLSNDVEAISQDSRGYMWFGTTDGISVYDGKSFTSYTIQEGLPSNVVVQLLADRKTPETMWALAGGTVCKYAEGKFTSYTLDVGVVYSMYQDIHGVLWCGTDRGVCIVSRDVVTAFYPHVLNKDVLGVAESGDSVMWFAHQTSVTRYSRVTHEFKEIVIPQRGVEVFRSMRSDREGNLWVAKGSGAFVRIGATGVVGGQSGLFGHLSGYFATTLYDVEGDNIWAIGYNGISRVSKTDFGSAPTIHYTTDNGLAENTLRSAFIDREGNLWVGGRDRGVAKLSNWNIYRFPLGSVWYVHHHQFDAADSSNHLWIIANETLTEFWKDRYGGWHRFAHAIAWPDSLILQDIGGPRIFSSLFYDGKGKLWISSLKFPGLIECFDIVPGPSPDGVRPSSLKPVNRIWVGREFGDGSMRIFCFIVDRRGYLWVSIANGGIALYDTRGGGKLLRVFNEPDKINYIRTLYEDRSGAIWAGSFNNGLFSLPAGETLTGKFRRYTTADGLPDNAIWDIEEDRAGRLIVGTSHGGLVVREGDSLRTLSSRNGLPSNKIFSISQDSVGRLWLATSVGMVYEDRPGSESFLKTQPFVGSTALCSGAMRDGLLWFVTATDLIVYDYSHEAQKSSYPLVHITGLKVNGTPVPKAGETRLSHDQNNCEISFIGISFKDEGAIRYRYRLMNAGDAWQGPTYATSIHYGLLSPGSYRFEVTAINVDGRESLVPARIGITISPPFWKNHWFESAAVASLFVIGWYTYRIRTRRIVRERKISQDFSRQLIESQEVERKRVAGELHDGLGQELMVIVNRAHVALRAGTADPAREHIEEIASTASRAIENVREMAYNLSPYHLEHIGLAESIKSMVEKVAGLTPTRFAVECEPVDSLVPKDVELSVYRIVQECVNNIVKHSNASEAGVRIRSDGKALEIHIRDDGRGFEASAGGSASARRKGFGLTGLAERVKLLRGTLTIVSAPEKGTTITITIPIVKPTVMPATKKRG